MEIVVVILGIGVGVEDGFLGLGGVKVDWVEVNEDKGGVGWVEEDVIGIIRGFCCFDIGDFIRGCRFRWMSGFGGGIGGGGGGNCFRSFFV